MSESQTHLPEGAVARDDSPRARGDLLPLTLIVFAYNEALNVPTVLPEILRWLRGRSGPYQLVFVNDGSTDETEALARVVLEGDANATVVSHPRNKGIGAAIKTGVRTAVHPWVTFLPCDGQIPVEDLAVLTEGVAREGVRLAFSVYEARDDGAHRKVLSAGVRGLIRAVHGVTMRSDGPYLFRRELFDEDLLAPDTFFLNFEFPIRMARAREPHVTVTIRCVPRVAGVSKSTGLKRVAGVAKDLFGLRARLWAEAVGLSPSSYSGGARKR